MSRGLCQEIRATDWKNEIVVGEAGRGRLSTLLHVTMNWIPYFRAQSRSSSVRFFIPELLICSRSMTAVGASFKSDHIGKQK